MGIFMIHIFTADTAEDINFVKKFKENYFMVSY